MPTIDNRDEDEVVVEVLVTGFGPFGRVKDNPSFLCTKDLHDLILESIPSPIDGSPRAKRIHVQVIQTSVAYSHTLDLVPRIHGLKPSSTEAKIYLDPEGEQPDPTTGLGAQGNGSHFPQGYRGICVPAKGYWDHVVHFGVGLNGSVAIETVAHKRGYQLPDVKGERAPIALDQSATKRRGDDEQSAAEKGEEINMQASPSITTSGRTNLIRGFGQGYRPFDDELQTDNEVTRLVEWLKQDRGYEHIRQSTDPGRFLCDYIFYCSLAERQRSKHQTTVQFVHVPPLRSPYTLQDLQRIARDVVTWIGSQ